MSTHLLSTAREKLNARWLQVFLYGLAFSVGGMLLAFSGEVTNDSWWHLKFGQELWEGTFSFYDTHNWTAPGVFWPAHELGFEWILYGLWLAGGESFILMALINVLLVLGSFALLLPPKRVREKFQLNWNIFVPLIILGASYLTLGSVQIRAQALSFFLFALTVRLILSKKPYLFPLLALVWAWLHASIFIGIALMGIATLVFIGRWLFDRSAKDKFKDALHYSIAGLLSLVAASLSPLGLGIWTYFVSTFGYGDTKIMEWAPLTDVPIMTIQAAVVAILLGLSLWRLWPKKTSWELVYLYSMSAFLLIYSLDALRVFSNFVLISLPILYIAAMTFFKKSTAPVSEEKAKLDSIFTKVAAGFVVLLVTVSAFFSYGISAQVMENKSYDPFAEDGVAAMLRSDLCFEATWNDYDTGSYLLWFMPDIKVSIDSRFDLYPEWVRNASGVTVPPGDSDDPTDKLNAVFEEYSINCMVMTNTTDADALRARGLNVLAYNQDMIVFEIPESGIPARRE